MCWRATRLKQAATCVFCVSHRHVVSSRSRGIGSTVLGQLIDEGRASSRIVTIHVEKFNRALRLYERLGFRIADDRGVYWFLQWSPVARPAAN